MKHVIKINKDSYIVKVRKHTDDSWLCSVYKKVLGVPVRVHKRVYLRNMVNTDSYIMCWNTVYDYESTNIK